MIIYDKQLLALGQKYIKMKLYVQMLVNTECETHPFIPNLQGFFQGLYCCWLSRGSDKARFSDSGVLSA